MIAHRSLVLLRLRWVQLRRALSPIGRLLLALALVAGVWLMHRAAAQDATYALWITLGVALVVLGLHQRRPDHHFVQRHLPTPHIAMALEYGTLLLPAWLALLLAQAWWPAAGLLLVPALAWLPVAQNANVRGAWLRRWIPPHLFEWRSLLQNTHPLGLLLWLAALALCWLPVLPLFLLGIITLVMAGAQEHCEPRAMLLVSAPDAATLLRRKIRGALWIMILLQLPVLIGATLFRPAWWWIHGLFGLGMVALLAYAVALKYANYRPNERLEANGANISVAAVFAILPGLSLVPLIMLLSELRKARANLNTYFHAHHR